MLQVEAKWAWEEVLSQHMLTENDSSVIFQSWNELQNYLEHLKGAFHHTKVLHAVAIKTNPHIEVLRKIVSWGYGLEAASIEEVKLALKAGALPERIVFDSPVKRRSEIETCQAELHGIRFNVNSLEELARLPSIPNFPVGIRINPMVETGAPQAYHVSHDESKFGVPISQKEYIIAAILKYPIVQLHLHSGSSMSRIDSAVAAVKAVVSIAHEANTHLAEHGIERRITTIDIGGGLIPERLVQGEQSRMQKYASSLREECPTLWTNFEVITEFGQWTLLHRLCCISS